MIRLVYSNRTEELLAALAETLRARRAAGAHPLEPVELVVPNRNLEQHVRLALAERLGVAANLRFRRLERFVAELTRTSTGARPGVGGRLVDAEALRGALLAVLHDAESLATRELAPVRGYLEAPDADGVALRRVQLAGRLAQLFEEYAYSRPEMLLGWPVGPALREGHLGALEAWQRALWLAVAGPGGWLARHPPAEGRWVTLAELADGRVPLPAGEPPLHVFGISYVARAFQRLFHRLAGTRELWLFTLNPCQELWDDVETERELRRRQARHRGPLPAPEDDPYNLFQDTENLPLRYWGRPGREHVRLLDDLTECDFTARFAAPDAGGEPTLLAALQADVLRRAATGERPPRPDWAGDGSVRVLACPDPRREVEAVADAIWKLVAASDAGTAPLRFSDVAVLVNAGARDRYLPQVQAVFAEYHGIPCNVADLPFAGERRVAEAARLLLALPFGRFSRAEMLRVMLHPAVRGRFPEVDREEWARLADELGIFHGASREDLAGTYVGEDLLSWDQGLRRLALGAFLTGQRSGEERLWVAADGSEVLPADVTAGRLESAARFALLARSLLADCRRLREEQRPLGEWADVLRNLLSAYLTPGDGEEGDLARCLGAMATLERADVGAVPVTGRVACELAAAALAEMTVGRGSWLGEGVAVSTLLPMRAIPFRVVFALGLGEGEFPAANRRDALDLRAAARLAGDVTPAERDRYLFLETLLSARERLALSFVSRDERTGETLRPSSVVQELLDVLERGYVGAEGTRALVEQVPPRRWDAAALPSLEPARDAVPTIAWPTVAPGAREEAAARRLGEGLLAAVPEPTGDVLATLRRELPVETWSPLAGFLALPALPPPTRGAGVEDVSAATRALTTSTLRAFLECPMQGSAKALLGLERDDDEDPAEVEDEALRSSRLVETVLLRDAFARALRRGEDPRVSYAALARPRELGGKLPTGALGAVERDLHGELLAGWHAAVAGLAARGRGERLRLGRAPELEEFDDLLPALTLNLGLGPGLELHGRSELLLDGRRASVVCDPGGPKDDPREEWVRELRLALRGFFDHLLLAASGSLAGVKRQLVLLRRDATGPCLVRYDLQAMRRDEALAYLTTLAGDLLSGVHDYLLPCEAVFDVYRGRDRRLPLDPREVAAEAVRRITTDRVACASRWGPVPDGDRYPPPSPIRLAEILARRFAPFLNTLSVRWATASPGAAA
jgi:exodeoxyribonuclease V gamma subunit